MNVSPRVQIWYISTKKMEVILEEGGDGSLLISLQSGTGDKLVMDRMTEKHIAIDVVDRTKRPSEPPRPVVSDGKGGASD